MIDSRSIYIEKSTKGAIPMTALNWTKDRARRIPREVSYDDLPPTGSWADRQRYGVYPSSASRPKHGSQQPSSTVIRDRGHDFEQLNTYLEHAQHPDFQRKASVQRLEIISIIRRLVNKCQYWEAALSKHESHRLLVAIAFLKAQAH